MGRYSTGKLTTGEVMRIELSHLLKAGKIKRNDKCFGSISWNNGSYIYFESSFTDTEKYLRLKYTITHYTGEKTHLDYNIQLTSIPSNLGIGEVIYFVCPQTGKRARILYKCYGSQIWKHREAYKTRIYYQCQTLSKITYNVTRAFVLDNLINVLASKAHKTHYRGKKTRLIKRMEYLETKSNYHDDMMLRTFLY